MGKWIIKALVQKAISLFPQRHNLNYFFQKHLTGNAKLTSAIFEEKLEKCNKHLKNYFLFSTHKKTNFKSFELGTGRFPIIPLGFFLCGSREIWTIDIAPLVLKSTLKTTLEFFIDYSKNRRLWRFLPMASQDRINDLRNALRIINIVGPYKTLEKLQVYAIIEKSADTYPACSFIDLFVSNNTFEHIPESSLLDRLKGFKRIASDNCVMSHFIDMRDHYYYFEKVLSPLNFLRYSESQWKIFNNSLQYQNRLTVSDYIRVHNKAGFKVVLEWHKKATPEELKGIKLEKRFSKYPKEELRVLECWIVSKIAQ